MSEESFNQLFKAIGSLESKVDTLIAMSYKDSGRIDRIECAYQGMKGSLWTASALLGLLNLIYLALQVKEVF